MGQQEQNQKATQEHNQLDNHNIISRGNICADRVHVLATEQTTTKLQL